MKLSKIKEIPPRTYWHNEATDFTPWLAEEDNLAQLSEVIYLDLELVSREERMDGGRADLLCKDTVTGNSVIIENQLEKTDPDHLGRILSYAAALKANTIIWIATEFDEQYRATIDWLNSVTDEEFNFFGIEIHLLQIGDSDYAPQFKVVAKPNDWQKQVKASSKHDAEELTETKKSQLEYWQAFAEYMAKHPSHHFKTQSPLPQHWMNIAIGRSGFYISLNVNSRENKNMIQLWINSTDPKGTFDSMAKDHKNNSQTAISPDIDWQRLDNRKQCVISLSHPFTFTDKSTQDEQFKWFRDVTESFVKFFKPIVKNL